MVGMGGDETENSSLLSPLQVRQEDEEDTNNNGGMGLGDSNRLTDQQNANGCGGNVGKRGKGRKRKRGGGGGGEQENGDSSGSTLKRPPKVRRKEGASYDDLQNQVNYSPFLMIWLILRNPSVQ